MNIYTIQLSIILKPSTFTSYVVADRQPLHDVEIIPIATGNDWKDTQERAFNKLAWGLFKGAVPSTLSQGLEVNKHQYR
jgi:hypothetical protein